MPYSDEYVKKQFKYTDEASGRRFRSADLSASGLSGGGYNYEWNGVTRVWRSPISTMRRYETENRLDYTGKGLVRYKYYLDEMAGNTVQTIWNDVLKIHHLADERLDYPTQKPKTLLERIIKASSNESEIVADFFCGSGTTAAVAEKLGRKWITSDLGKFAIHTTRKRMIGVQRSLKEEGKNYRAFEILNLGKYQREHYVGTRTLLSASHSIPGDDADKSVRAPSGETTRAEMRQQMIAQKEREFVELILRAYQAEKTDGFSTFHGKKAGRLVAVGPINLPVTRLFVEEVIGECRQKRITRVDILGFEFEMGLFPNLLEEAKAKGIDIAPKYIPAEVFDKRAVEKNQVRFHDVSFIEVKPHIKKKSVAVELTDFSVFYSQDSIATAETTLKNKASKIVVEKGQIVKVLKDADGVVTRETLTQNWTDWIDYWSVDFYYENKRELIRRPLIADDRLPGVEADQQSLIAYEEVWTGDYVFENEWQSFRTKRDQTIELKSVYHECSNGRRKIAVKVVDLFGNDTMTIIEVNI